MKIFSKATFLFVLVIYACQPPLQATPSLPDEPILQENELLLNPILDFYPEITQIEFLIDNSNSVEDETKGGCGKTLGEGRFEYVRFLTGIFQASIPDKFLNRLNIGVSTFGNVYNPLLQSIPLDPNSIIFIPSPDTPVNNTRYTSGIQGALGEMYKNTSIQKRYLIILTDGEQETETADVVRNNINNYKDSNLNIYIALLCPSHYATWSNSMTNLSNTSVYNGLDNLTTELFKDLTLFLPKGSLLITSNDNKSEFEFSGYTTAINFSYWASVITSGSYLKIYSDSVNNNFSKSFTVFETHPYNNIYPSEFCASHRFKIDPPQVSKWFLFVYPQKFEDLVIKFTSPREGLVEIINGVPLDLQFEINEPNSWKTLKQWQDCFSASLIWSTINQTNQVNNGYINFSTCNLIDDTLCYKTIPQWSPEFSDTGDIEITIQVTASDGVSWKTAPKTFPIKFRPKYDFINSVPFIENTPLNADKPKTLQKDFIFTDASSFSHPNIYLVSSTGDLNNNSCPNPTHKVNGLYALQVVPVTQQECSSGVLLDVATAKRVCIAYNYHTPITVTYNFFIVSRIAKPNCQYNHLYFDWLPSDKFIKEITWQCDFLNYKDCFFIPKPLIEPIQ